MIRASGLILLYLWGATAWALTGEEILEKCDNIRIPNSDFKVDARVVSKRPNHQDESATYEVLLKGKNRTLIKLLSPATDRGISVLMVNQDLWVFLPDVSQPVRVSLQQRLLGEVANGDLARMNFVGDYEVSLVQNTSTFYKLALKAKTEDITYGSIQLWIEKGTFRPLKTAFFAASGRLLKVGSYEDYKLLGGAIRPGKLVLNDAIRKGQVSTIYYDRVTREADIPEKYFTKDYLKKLKY